MCNHCLFYLIHGNPHNFIFMAFFVPKTVKIGGNLTTMMTTTILLVVLKHDARLWWATWQNSLTK